MKKVIIDGNSITRINEDGSEELSHGLLDLPKLESLRTKKEVKLFAEKSGVEIPDSITKLVDMKEFVSESV